MKKCIICGEEIEEGTRRYKKYCYKCYMKNYYHIHREYFKKYYSNHKENNELKKEYTIKVVFDNFFDNLFKRKFERKGIEKLGTKEVDDILGG